VAGGWGRGGAREDTRAVGTRFFHNSNTTTPQCHTHTKTLRRSHLPPGTGMDPLEAESPVAGVALPRHVPHIHVRVSSHVKLPGGGVFRFSTVSLRHGCHLEGHLHKRARRTVSGAAVAGVVSASETTPWYGGPVGLGGCAGSCAECSCQSRQTSCHNDHRSGGRGRSWRAPVPGPSFRKPDSDSRGAGGGGGGGAGGGGGGQGDVGSRSYVCPVPTWCSPCRTPPPRTNTPGVWLTRVA
jgi:hypothetical protein